MKGPSADVPNFVVTPEKAIVSNSHLPVSLTKALVSRQGVAGNSPPVLKHEAGRGTVEADRLHREPQNLRNDALKRR